MCVCLCVSEYVCVFVCVCLFVCECMYVCVYDCLSMCFLFVCVNICFTSVIKCFGMFGYVFRYLRTCVYVFVCL